MQTGECRGSWTDQVALLFYFHINSSFAVSKSFVSFLTGVFFFHLLSCKALLFGENFLPVKGASRLNNVDGAPVFFFRFERRIRGIDC